MDETDAAISENRENDDCARMVDKLFDFDSAIMSRHLNMVQINPPAMMNELPGRL